MTAGDERQPDLLSDLSDLDLVRHLLADLHDDLLGKITRLRMLADLSQELGREGTMISGGQAAHLAWVEARTSFVHGNFMATVLLCQGLAEHLLAAYLHGALMMDDLPERVPFRETLRRAQNQNVIADRDVADLERLMSLRTPLSHFRHLHDAGKLDRRSMEARRHADDLMREDATFAIGLAVRMLAKPAFRLG